MTRILTIGNQKGGQGRTTTVVTLGRGLAMRGKRVLLVDADPQGQVATFLGLRQESGLFDLLVEGRSLADVVRSADADGRHRPGLQVIPGDKRTATAQVVLVAQGIKLDCLARALKGVEADYVICDTSPFVGLLQEAAIFAADWLLVPCAVDYAAAQGLASILDTVQAVEDRGGRCHLLGVIPTFYDEVTRESKAILAQLKERFGKAVWPPIHRATVLRECAAEAVTIFEKAPRSRAATEYGKVVERVLDYG
jgi:chromosome partitioning protein